VDALTPVFAALGPGDLLFLQARCIQQHHAGQFPSRGRADHLSAEALLHQQRDAPAVIEVGMSEEQRVE